VLSARHRAHLGDAALVADDPDHLVLAVELDRLDREQHVPGIVGCLQALVDRDHEVVAVLGQAAHVDADPPTGGPEVLAGADRHPDVRGAEALGDDVLDGFVGRRVGDRLTSVAGLRLNACCRRMGHMYAPDYSVAVT